jgi:RND family efflux transporter MFP subunit
MKNILPILLVSFTLLAVSCKRDNAAGGDKKAQLADLKKQQADLNMKIAALEKELGAGDAAKKEKVLFVTTQKVTPSVFQHFIELQGAVVADDEYFLNAKAAGSITKMNLKVGDRVTAGQVVAEIDDDMVRQQIEEIKKRWELASEVFQKQEALWKQNIGSEVQYLSAKNNKEALEKTMATIEKSREYYRIVAPVSGVVDEVNLKMGQVVSPGIPLAKIVNLSKLKVKVDAPETYAGKLRSGNSVVVNFPDLNKEIPSKINYIGNSVNPLNRTFKVEIPIRANEANVLPNMASVVKVIDYTNNGAFVVPINLVQKDLTGNDYVMIEAGGLAKKALVKVGQMYGDKAEILSGLKSGDNIVVTGYQDLNDGDKVQLQ